MKETQGGTTITTFSKEGPDDATGGKGRGVTKSFQSQTANFIAIRPLVLFQQTSNGWSSESFELTSEEKLPPGDTNTKFHLLRYSALGQNVGQLH